MVVWILGSKPLTKSSQWKWKKNQCSKLVSSHFSSLCFKSFGWYLMRPCLKSLILLVVMRVCCFVHKKAIISVTVMNCWCTGIVTDQKPYIQCAPQTWIVHRIMTSYGQFMSEVQVEYLQYSLFFGIVVRFIDTYKYFELSKYAVLDMLYLK